MLRTFQMPLVLEDFEMSIQESFAMVITGVFRDEKTENRCHGNH